MLAQLELPKSTYYRWLGRQEEGFQDRSFGPRFPWNRLRPEEEQAVLALARAAPELSPRELAFKLTDTEAFSASEATAYRLLRWHGLVKRTEVLGFQAGKEYHHKTTGPHQLWATGAAYFRVAGWGWYYLVTVLDDYSRYIIAWRLQQDMAAPSLIEVVQEAVERTGMYEVPLHDRTNRTTGRAASRTPSPTTSGWWASATCSPRPTIRRRTGSWSATTGRSRARSTWWCWVGTGSPFRCFGVGGVGAAGVRQVSAPLARCDRIAFPHPALYDGRAW